MQDGFLAIFGLDRRRALALTWQRRDSCGQVPGTFHRQPPTNYTIVLT